MTHLNAGQLIAILSIISTGLLAEEQPCEKMEIPIIFDSYGLPTIQLALNGTNHQVLLDLGSSDGIHLPKTEIEKFSDVKYTGKTVINSNISGETFESKEFEIPLLKGQCISFENIRGIELAPWAASLGEDKIAESEPQIVVGLDLFKNKSIAIDYAKKILTIKNNKMNKPASTTNTPSINYRLSEEGISIKMSSANSDYQMVLDSGASSSIFVANKVNPKETIKTCDFDVGPNVKCQLFNSSLKVGEYDFHTNALLYPIDQRFKLDGLLGSDFFNQFIVEINFSNNTLVLTPNNMNHL